MALVAAAAISTLARIRKPGPLCFACVVAHVAVRFYLLRCRRRNIFTTSLLIR